MEDELTDSKNIYIACNHTKTKVLWDDEWIFIGDGACFKEKEFEEAIKSFFSEERIFVIIDRHNSYPTDLNEVASQVKHKLKNQDIFLCDKSFNKMIHINYIGVFKYGIVK